MAQQETPGTPSDVPKRSKHFFRDIGKKQILYIVLPLLLVNAGVAHLLIDQVAIRAGAQNEVKDVSTGLSDVGSVDTNTAPEENIAPDPVITTYVVKSGDTLSGIADKFNITINTIRWANDLTEKTSKIAVGDELVILPVSGIEYTVKKGDTLSGIATKFDAKQEDILKYNDIEASAIKVGTDLIIPGGEPVAVKAPEKKVVKPAPVAKVATTTTTKITETSAPKVTVATKESSAEEKPVSKTTFTNPIPGGVLTQRIHDGNAVDFGAPVGTPVLASADGVVLIAKDSGYNGGYGSYIVINHTNGSQTLYGHLSKVFVSVGDKVSQGEKIGLSGNTGMSTGPHLHYKESNTGARNTFVNLPLH